MINDTILHYGVSGPAHWRSPGVWVAVGSCPLPGWSRVCWAQCYDPASHLWPHQWASALSASLQPPLSSSSHRGKCFSLWTSVHNWYKSDTGFLWWYKPNLGHSFFCSKPVNCSKPDRQQASTDQTPHQHRGLIFSIYESMLCTCCYNYSCDDNKSGSKWLVNVNKRQKKKTVTVWV